MLALAALLAPAVASAGNFAECIIESVPGVRHQQVLHAAIRACHDKYPAGIDSVKWGSGRGFFSKYNSTDECFAAEGRETSMSSAAIQIFQACNRLYGNEPTPDWENGIITPPSPR
ncbi:hypothetical protein DNK49_19160 [Azoarcus communis]|uniref:Secreted protein n=1 Tax=Parazoarcus communis SWub3 = DSM 12120 TaxID=1121029 RepID=A0A323UR28_9RHOO|nr:hypothetical protein DNK49_19160 [Azoarcus communis] [Parazoarcus communis SWub3 = DSM 12120]